MKCAPLAMVLALAALINCTSCQKCSNCSVKIYIYECYNQTDTIVYPYGNFYADSILMLEAQGYTCDVVAMGNYNLNNQPVCSKKEIESYETQTGVTCNEIE